MRFDLLVCLPFLLTTVGCFGPAADVAANGLVLGGAADPAFSGLAQPFEAGVVLAYPRSFTDLESNLVTDADAVWINVDGAPVTLENEDNGLYLYKSSVQTAVQYTAGASVEVRANVDGEQGIVTVVAPAPPDLSAIPQTRPMGTPLVVELNDDFALAYGAVIDSQGFVVWDDRPTTTQEVIAELADAGSVERYMFPADAFPAVGTYGLALVGIKTAEGADYAGFEAFWSNIGVGAIGTGYTTITL